MANETDPTATRLGFQPKSGRHLGPMGQLMITTFYVFGIGSNVIALLVINRPQIKGSRKHTVMVTCLMSNDLLALAGSLVLMHIQLYVKKFPLRWLCVFRVLLRSFGMTSGAVAAVMSIERWLNFTKPFLYQKHVTYKLIKRTIFSLWLFVLVLVCLPFLGFGLYYNSEASVKSEMCARYRYAKTAKDVAYAYLVFAFGLLLCIVIVCCNLAVVRVLCKIGNKKCMARLGRTFIHKKSNELSFNHATAEEVSFAKLMVVLCIFFIICWVPQLATILTAQIHPDSKFELFYRMADICLAMNFALDPMIYVLSRRPHRKDLRKLLKPVCQLCTPKPDRIPSVRTTSQDNV